MISGTRSRAHEFGLNFDDTAWPILYVRFPSTPLDDEGVQYFIDRYSAIIELRIPFVAIIDSRGLSNAIGASERKKLTEWFDVSGPLAGEHHYGIAVLLNNPIVRGALKAVTWVKPVPVPIKPFASLADAAPWLREIMTERGIPITPAMEQLLAGRG